MTIEQTQRMVNAIAGVCEMAPDAVARYGQEAQLDMMIEECAELIQAICHRRRGRESDVPGELADVLIVAMQVACIVGADRVIDEVAWKAHSLRTRMLREVGEP